MLATQKERSKSLKEQEKRLDEQEKMVQAQELENEGSRQLPGGCDEEVAKCGIDTEKETIECQGGCRQEAACMCKESGQKKPAKK